ncbi:restriction endonuclease [Micromonospora palythoicola]|uniref:restriction endonuclease n=1 Tax=Micromonospora palythoicola TaxID=3120507 RepID=UPI002FCE46B4
MNATPYHFPPEVFAVLKDVIPLLCRSKLDVLDFFRGAGVAERDLEDLRKRIAGDRNSINKYEIVRQVLTRVNEHGDSGLAARRQIIRRVVEFEDLYTCWPDDQLKAKGLVAELRSLVEVKDTFVRIRQERDAEREQRLAAARAEAARVAQRRAAGQDLQRRLAQLFGMSDSHRRGLALEAILNETFALDGILVRDSFVLRAADGTAVEQIDGVVELDGVQYLVEMKWHADKLGMDPVSRHLVRIYGRAGVGGILISASGFTEPAIEECGRALAQRVIVLAVLRELVLLLERDGNVAQWLRTKIRAAIIDRKPFVEV